MPDVRGPDAYKRDPYGDIKIEPVDSNKSTEDRDTGKGGQNKEPTLLATLMFIFKKFLKTLLRGPTKNPIIDDLKELKALFLKLTVDDLSQDLEFLNILAFKWLDIVKKYEESPKKIPLEVVKLFFDEIYAFPSGQTYSLGYYLTEHAGYQWVPLPFMEILYNLHMEYQLNSSESHLKRWIDQLDDMTEKH